MDQKTSKLKRLIYHPILLTDSFGIDINNGLRHNIVMKKILVLLVVFVMGCSTIFGIKGTKRPNDPVDTPATKKQKTQQTLLDAWEIPDVFSQTPSSKASTKGKPRKRRIKRQNAIDHQQPNIRGTLLDKSVWGMPITELNASPKSAFESSEVTSSSHEASDSNSKSSSYEIESDAKKTVALTVEERFKYRRSFVKFASDFATGFCIEETTLIDSARELKKRYDVVIKGQRQEVIDFVKEESDLKFCCSFLIYHLCENKYFESIAPGIKEVFPEIEMSKAGAIDLIKHAQGQYAYLFRQSIGVREDDEVF